MDNNGSITKINVSHLHYCLNILASGLQTDIHNALDLILNLKKEFDTKEVMLGLNNYEKVKEYADNYFIFQDIDISAYAMYHMLVRIYPQTTSQGRLLITDYEKCIALLNNIINSGTILPLELEEKCKKYIRYMLNTPGQEVYIKSLYEWLKGKHYNDVIPEVKRSVSGFDNAL
jgi:hypothetical protein